MIRINEKINLQNKNIKLMSKATCIVITTSLIGCLLAGCSKTTFENTELEGVYVAKVDEKYEPVKVIIVKECYSNNKDVIVTDHRHYMNIVSSEILTDDKSCSIVDVKRKHSTETIPTRYVENIEFYNSILDYMETEEYKKACNDRLTGDDYSNIISRIQKDEKVKILNVNK